jgi:GNAT superfamily N-acetyltransferase
MPVDTVEIQAAQAADLPSILQLLRTQLEEHGIVLTGQALRHATQGLIDDPARGRILKATLGGELVGVAVISFLWTLEHGGAAAWLDEVYVEPPRRGAGIGGQLVLAAMQVARDSGCIALDLEVDAGHEAAERLYERMGFRRHNRVRWFYPLSE